MALFPTPEESAANPPESWLVVKAADRVWHLTTADGGVLDTFKTKTDALSEAAWIRKAYEKEAAWYRGEEVAGWRPYAEILAERAELAAR